MKQNRSRRFVLCLIQHLALALAVLICVVVFQESVIQVSNYGDVRIYRIDPFGDAESFEDTEAFSQMFYDTVSDLVTLAVIKQQFETDGVYDGSKLIDVTAFVNRRNETVSDSTLTAVYYLDDLIKWDKSGADTVTYSITKKEFVNFFQDNLLDIDHYYLSEDASSLRYSYEVITDRTAEISVILSDEAEAEDLNEVELAVYEQLYLQKLQEVYDNYMLYNEAQLVDMAFSYVASHMDKPVSIVEENGEEMIEFQMLRSKYLTADTQQTLVELSDSWINYCKLENNVIDVMESLGQNYDLYEERNDMYAAGNTNVKYLFRIACEDGSFVDYSNISEEFSLRETEEMDNYFRDLKIYLSYAVDDIFCDSNVDFSDEEIYSMVSTHSYAFPEETRIWIGIGSYTVEDDLFAVGSQVFERIAHHIRNYTMVVISCLVIWLGLWSYLTFTAGRRVAEDGEVTVALGGFDRMYTEFLVGLAALFAVIGYVGLDRLLPVVAADYYQTETYLSVMTNSSRLALYLLSFSYGFLASFTFTLLWYSLVRRIRGGNLWQDSLLHHILARLSRGAYMVVYHRNAATRTLIPYNLFLLANMLGLVYCSQCSDNRRLFLAILAILIFDALVGVLLFRNNAEFAEIVEAIKRIRQGDMDGKLELEKFHGENQEIAEAVNNIREGMRDAVATSVKDERIKSDLITNVSHDIKTPLTSIISYVDLLKREKIEQEPAKGYIDILDAKTQRLKQLTDDLVEASKISSGNIILQREKLNLAELINQAIGEFSERFEEKGLETVFEGGATEAFIYADSRRMWRIIENLFTNVFKYAMNGTRVFITLHVEEDVVEAAIKNISAQHLKASTEDLTERFFRGDESRTTEGSGLGLSIAKSLAELQDGTLSLSLDGDLFKVILRFSAYGIETEDIE